MLTKLRIGRWVLRVDPEATRTAYKQLAGTALSGSGCTCDYCRNFDAVVPAMFPVEAMVLFEQLGINPRFPREVYEYYQIRPGEHEYGGQYFIVGHLLDGEAKSHVSTNGAHVSTFTPLEHEPLGTGFGFLFTATHTLPWSPDAFRPYPVIALDFTVLVPWVLETPDIDEGL